MTDRVLPDGDLEFITGTIEKLVQGGQGLLRTESGATLVPRTAPGDRVRVGVEPTSRAAALVRKVEILARGPGRRDPPCPHFERCGGCDLQHLEDDLQLRAKTAAALETLRRIGGREDLPSPEVFGAEPWGYRMRARVHLERRAGVVRAGFHERGTTEVLSLTCCKVMAPELEKALVSLPSLVGTGRLPPEVSLALGDDGTVCADPAVPGLSSSAVSMSVGGLAFFFDAGCFFQAHRSLLPRLVQEVIGDARGELAYDLYSGVGLFALPLSLRFKRVVAVESDSRTAGFALGNAKRNGRTNVEVRPVPVEKAIRELPAGTDLVVVDPPRSGLPGKVAACLLERRPGVISYVSCHAAALGRDLKRLGTAYRLQKLSFLDLFPQTGHLEIVASLRG
jgi:23S rRNA (uracil1939-C5)-methyltransferase